MSEEGFLKRWSRKKRTEPPAVEGAPAGSPPPSRPQQGGEGSAVPPPRGGESQEGAPSQVADARAARDDDAIDPATLPSIESLGPDSDYTVFLKKGVPEALRLAALRKAWMSDPFIRDFPSPAIDYGWDFTTPDYSLRPGDDVEKLLDQIFPPRSPARAEQAATPAPVAAQDAPAPPSGETPAAPELRLPQKEAAPPLPQSAPEPAPAEPVPTRRKHGGALPD